MRKFNVLVVLCSLFFIQSLYGAQTIPSTQNITTSDNYIERPIIRIETSKGDIIVKLYPDKAPLAVENFLTYVNDGFYTNTLFHRVIDGFIIQGGGFEAGFKAKKTREPIKNESDTGLKNIRGTLGLALTTDSNSGASQFYINIVNNPKLDFDTVKNKHGYTAFGEVIDGMKVVDRIRKVRTKQIQIFSEFYNRTVPIKDVPEEDIFIKSITLLRN